jgi:glutathione synthase/RimK-type ligase-like ATP-grasp enzyme
VKALVVVENTRRWRLRLRGVDVVSARDYLSGETWDERRGLRVYNFCRTFGYQKLGYYVSLLAAARGHRPLPTVETLHDLRLSPVVRLASEQLETLIARCLGRLKGDRFELAVYFGKCMARRYEALARAVYDQFPAPLLRASFERENAEWRLVSVGPIATSDIPDAHHDFVVAQFEAHFGRPPRAGRRRVYRYDLAILTAPNAEDSPSNPQALRRFAKAAREQGLEPHFIGREDAGDIAEFDALFLRETTRVDHPTFRLARRAAAEGLVVIDDPTSILRCTNKVYQAELFERYEIPAPKTMVVHEDAVDQVSATVGLPCVLKRPDSSFSQGVVRVDTEDELRLRVGEFLRDSDLVIAQAYTPSSFDWRIGVLGGDPLWACRYHMARGHWQIVATREGRRRYGRVEAVPLETVPSRAVQVAVRAARLIGDGLYGVDVKEVGRRFLVMEVNDNPNVDAGCEDAVTGEKLYVAVMEWFRRRLDARGREAPLG